MIIRIPKRLGTTQDPQGDTVTPRLWLRSMWFVAEQCSADLFEIIRTPSAT
jgi:hypothetical protein